MFVWGAIVVSSVDNFLKPMIISRGSALPFVLVLLGVLGGAVAFGFVGVFLGPVLLAVGYALMKEWAVGYGAGGNDRCCGGQGRDASYEASPPRRERPANIPPAVACASRVRVRSASRKRCRSGRRHRAPTRG